ncbi:MAG TPA: glycoside hydrolase family 44 protein [Kofleriaceae bacterium]|nr:glycoside hydrolase family 44 protein [Kofleriaceae bacterium]
MGCNSFDGQPGPELPAAATEVSALESGDTLVIYDEALSAGWNDWYSWEATQDPGATTPAAHHGTKSMAVTFAGPYRVLELRPGAPISVAPYKVVSFWVHGGSAGGQQVNLQLRDGAGTLGAQVPITITAGQWTRVDAPLATLLGAGAQLKGIRLLEKSGSAAPPTFYVDELSLAPEPPAPPALSLSVDVAANRKAISTDIYGINGNISQDMAQTLRLPVRRWGGNAASRYNYELDATNVGSDWYFENVPRTVPVPAAPKDGSAANQFIQRDRQTSTRTLMTVPLLGWVAKDNFSCTFDATRRDASGAPVFGPQQAYDPLPQRSHCGNGVLLDGTLIRTTQEQKEYANRAVTPLFVESWVGYLVSKFGRASDGGVAFYNLDNEPMLWNDTHRDVFSDPLSYDGLRDRTYQYAAAIKAADPTAKTLGPVAWGWDEYRYSALDRVVSQQCLNEGKTKWWECTQDRKAHGDLPLVAWYLAAMRAYEQENGVRILDYLDLHYYPESPGLSRQPAGDSIMQAKRLRATRSLWDPSYVDESWISEPVQLIPRMRQWVNQYYPGTKLAITEYNFGALDHINGALAQADVLGIFGREGLDLATLWWYSDAHQPEFNLSHPGAFAFRVYRNYDGAGHGFGDLGVQAASTDAGQLTVYAAHRTIDGALTIVVINKSGQALTAPLNVSNFAPAGSAQVFRYSGANLGAIVREADQPVAGTSFAATYPPSSITLFVLPGG